MKTSQASGMCSYAFVNCMDLLCMQKDLTFCAAAYSCASNSNRADKHITLM